MKIFNGRIRAGGTVTINGNTITGKNITITSDGNVIADGVIVESVVGKVTVQIHGDVEQLETVSGDVEVHGNVGRLKTTSGDVTVGGNTGDINSISGDVTCSRASSVSTVSGDIRGAWVTGK